MVTLRSRDGDLLEKAFLKSLESELDRTQEQLRFLCLREPRVGGELLRLKRDEVSAIPVSVEDGLDLVDDVRIARAGHANVPLEAVHLSRVS